MWIMKVWKGSVWNQKLHVVLHWLMLSRGSFSFCLDAKVAWTPCPFDCWRSSHCLPALREIICQAPAALSSWAHLLLCYRACEECLTPVERGGEKKTPHYNCICTNNLQASLSSIHRCKNLIFPHSLEQWIGWGACSGNNSQAVGHSHGFELQDGNMLLHSFPQEQLGRISRGRFLERHHV